MRCERLQADGRADRQIMRMSSKNAQMSVGRYAPGWMERRESVRPKVARASPRDPNPGSRGASGVAWNPMNEY